jgi:hypothetical protein
MSAGRSRLFLDNLLPPLGLPEGISTAVLSAQHYDCTDYYCPLLASCQLVSRWGSPAVTPLHFGQSSKPYCDGSHSVLPFPGLEQRLSLLLLRRQC